MASKPKWRRAREWKILNISPRLLTAVHGGDVQNRLTECSKQIFYVLTGLCFLLYLHLVFCVFPINYYIKYRLCSESLLSDVVLSILSIFLFLPYFLCLSIPSLTFPCRCWHTHSAPHPHSCSKQFHLPTSYWCHDHPWEPAYYSCLSYMSSVIHVQNVGKSPLWRCSKQKNIFLPLVFDYRTELKLN